MYAGLDEGVSFGETTTDDGDAPSPVEEWRAHDSGWEDDLREPVRNPHHKPTVDTYLVGRRVEVSVDH